MNLYFTIASSCRVLVGLIETPNVYFFETLDPDQRQYWTSSNLHVGFVNIDTIVKSLPLIGFRVKHNMGQLQMFQKVEYGGGPIFKVVLEC